MATLYLFASFITSLSLAAPPGWIMAVTPCLIANSGPSAKGKKASEARTLPLARSPALFKASCTLSTALGWPAPIPNNVLSLATTMALDFMLLTAFQAKSRSDNSALLGWRLVTTPGLSSGLAKVSGFWTRKPPLTRRKSRWDLEDEGREGEILARRRLSFRLSNSRASF